MPKAMRRSSLVSLVVCHMSCMWLRCHLFLFRFWAVVKKERLGSKGGGKALMMQSAPRLATDLQ